MKYSQLILLSLLISCQLVLASNDGLVAKYLLQGNLVDSTGNHDDIINQGLRLTTDRCGKIDNAYIFEEFRDILIVPNSVVNGLLDYTVSFWQKKDNLSTNSAYFSWSNPDTYYYLYFYLYDSLIATSINNEFIPNPIEQFSNGEWQHVIVSRNVQAKKLSLYIDGSLFQEIDTTFGYTSDPVDIQGFVFGNIQQLEVYGGYTSGWQYKGSISDIRVYDRYFTEADAAALVQEDCDQGNSNNEPTDAQTCVNYLAVLKPSVITEELSFPLNNTDNEYYHHYNISFNEFQFDSSCFESQVWLGSNLLDHEVVDNGIIVQFPWKDAASWGCNQVTPIEQQCQFQVHVYLNSTLQHKKLFSSTITTPDLENITQELSLNVFNDEDDSWVQFDQTIDTQINFCSDLNCSSYANITEIIRNTDVYVEFKVNTLGYNQYYPIHKLFTLDGFQVDIQNQADIDSWAEQGRIIYHFRPPFAEQNILLTVGVSLSKENPNNGQRRVLQQTEGSTVELEEAKNDVGQYLRFSVVDETEDKIYNKQTQKEEDKQIIYYGIAIGVVMVIISVVAIIIYHKLKNQKCQGSQQQVKQNNNTLNIEQLDSEQEQLDIEVK